MNKRIKHALALVAGALKGILYWLFAGGVPWKDKLRTVLWRTGGVGLALTTGIYFAHPYVQTWHVVGGVLLLFGILLCVPQEKDPEPLMNEDDMLVSLWQLIGPNKGVHLATCALEWNCTMKDARELIESCEINIRQSVKVGGVVRTGVHRDDVPPPFKDDESEEWVVVPGQRATSTSTYVIKKGVLGPEAWFQDPFNPARTHVVQLGNREDSAA